MGSKAMSFGRDARLFITIQASTDHTPLRRSGRVQCISRQPSSNIVTSKTGTREQLSPADYTIGGGGDHACPAMMGQT